jgi:hypothetical protein
MGKIVNALKMDENLRFEREEKAVQTIQDFFR